MSAEGGSAYGGSSINMYTSKLIVALDVDNLNAAEAAVNKLYPLIGTFKIGSQLFTEAGPAAVGIVRAKGARVFLDLKFHDIPNTVSRTLAAVCEHEVDMVNVHALGGFEMMKAARDAVEKYSSGHVKKPRLIAVTVLTSHDQKALSRELRIRGSVKKEVLHLAGLAKKAGLDGIVCSPEETAWIRKKFKQDFLIVTPGIRPAGAEPGDQKRIHTPEKALRAGSDHLVVGRPITQAPNPKEAALQILEAIGAAH